MSDPNHPIPPRNLKSQRRAHMSFNVANPIDDDGIKTKPFRLRDVHIDIDKIFGDLKGQTVLWDVMDQNKPPIEFDDLGPYGVGKEEQMALWEFEVQRLVKAATSVDPPSLEGSPELFGQADTKGYILQKNLMAQLMLANNVCHRDIDRLLLKSFPRLISSDKKKKMLSLKYDIIRIRMHNKDFLRQQHGQAYHALVNYLTAILARILIRFIDSNEEMEKCFSILAKFTAKLKVVGTDIDNTFSTSTEREFQLLFATMSDSDSGFQGKEELYPNNFYAANDHYFQITDLMSHAIFNLQWEKADQDQKFDVFETSYIVYDTGFRGARAQLWQKRNGAIGMSDSRNHVRAAGIIFDACREIWETLPENSPGSALHWTTVDWSWTETSNIRHEADVFSRRRTLTDMKTVLEAFVPYSMLKDKSLDYLAKKSYNKVYESPTFLSAVRIRTTKYERIMMAKKKRKQIYQNIYDTPLAKERGLVRLVDDDSGHHAEHGSGSMTQRIRQYQDTNEEYRKSLHEVSSWVIDKRAIVITNVWYSYAVLAAIGVFTLSGIALMALGEHVPGVDPSNLTMLVWTTAGFLIVYFKSIRVENWPWRDFLRGRVVCRSVSEVVAVTKMDAQTLLAILLSSEQKMSLTKSGPFNSLFERVSDDGFAIDVPSLTGTAIAGGFIFVSVRGYEGMLLMGIRITSNGSYKCVCPHYSHNYGAVICAEPLSPGRYRMQVDKGRGDSRSSSSKTDSEYLPLHSLSRDYNEIYKEVLGIYTEEACFGGVGMSGRGQ